MESFNIEIKKNQNGINVVDARDLHSILEVDTRFNDWMRRMLDYGFVEKQDYYRYSNLSSADNQAVSKGGANKIDYWLTIDCAKEIAMVQRSERGHQVCQWFIDKEKELRLLPSIRKTDGSKLILGEPINQPLTLVESKPTQAAFTTDMVDVINENGKIWFRLKDIGTILEMSDATVRKMKFDGWFDEDEIKVVTNCNTLGGNQSMTYVSESAFYRILNRSRSPKARPFERWVTKEVIPSIRKTGSYSIQQNNPSYIIEDPLERAKAWIVEEEERRKLLAENIENKPKVGFYDELVDKGSSIGIRDTAKELGLKQTEFINWLIDHGYVYRDRSKKLKPYAKYCGSLFSIKEVKNDSNGFTGNQTLITVEGRNRFRQLLNNYK